ncbi:alpha/beta fold hydrolase, partial [Candidatus Daviesbacteria bacterium]|nr:alpha/beta fold hydrolase [Candidatus Daviesbacteria bacterium]
GTQRGGEVFAQNGFITLAPDFLGYGQSDNPSNNSMEERFQTYTAALALLSSLSNLNTGLEASYSGRIRADTEKIGLWGHSNGGYIALAVLEITGRNYPTVLWAPVSKPFPYSILYYTDEFDDHGKMLRKALWEFEKDYDAELYSPANYYSWIKAPIQLHQGTLDESIPIKWSDELVKTLEKLQKDIAYFVYPGADHNLLPNGWSLAVERSMAFYKSKFSQ